MRRRTTTWMVAMALLVAGGSACAAPPEAGGEPAHMVRGEVTTIDEARGVVTLKLSPAAVKGIKKGDHVTLRLSGSHGSGMAPKGTGALEESKSTAMPKTR